MPTKELKCPSCGGDFRAGPYSVQGALCASCEETETDYFEIDDVWGDERDTEML